MTKTSKIILFIMIITLLIVCGNVKAETIDMDYLSTHSTGNRQYNFTSYGGRQVDFTVNFDNSNMQVKDYSYIQGNLYVINKTQSKTNANTQNINWVETCTSHTDNGTTYGNNGRIVYADGTTAQIDYSQRTFYCNQWSTTGTVSNSDIQFNFDNSPSIQLMVRTNQNNELPCEINDTVFKCAIGQYEQLNYIKVRVLPKGTESDYWVSFSNVIYKVKSDTQTIINNNNQNYNEFKDSDISNQAKQPLDNTEVSGAEAKQGQAIENIENELDTTNPSFWDTLTIYFHPATITWIFGLINAIFNINPIFTAMVFTILTLGLAKLIYGR